MNQLVLMEHNEPMTTSLIIADGTKNQHESVMKLFKTHEKRFFELGISRFEIRKTKSGKRGRPVEYVALNEEQATFLIALMDNSDIVVDFKLKLVKEFYRMKRTLTQIMVRQQNEEWQQLRLSGKATRREQTDTIKLFVEYAKAQGSKSAHMYYPNLTKMENKALFLLEQKYDNLRDLLSGQQLQVLSSADMIVEKALSEGMKLGMHYKDIFKMAKERIELFASVIPIMPVPMIERQRPALASGQ